jgi:hypothetical protein
MQQILPELIEVVCSVDRMPHPAIYAPQQLQFGCEQLSMDAASQQRQVVRSLLHLRLFQTLLAGCVPLPA